jgi:hypothetical protein
MNIIKTSHKLLITIPLKQKSHNPYDDSVTELDNIIGVIAGNEYGFCHLIDMEYKGKEPQIGGWFVKFDEFSVLSDKKAFRNQCEKLGIELYEYPTCSKCGKVIYGCFTIGEKGDECFSCNTN